MPTIQSVAMTLAPTQKPVLLPDTCGLLDIIRLPLRDAAHLLASIDLVDAACQSSNCSCVLSSLLPKELADNLGNVVAEVNKRIDAIEKFLAEMAHICNLRHKPLATQNLKQFGLSQILEVSLQSIVSNALTLDSDPESKNRGLERAILEIPPFKKGQFKDCIVYEEYLEFARQLRANGHVAPIVFLTSNTNDYCDGSARLHAQLATEMAAVQLDYASNWYIASELLGLLPKLTKPDARLGNGS